MNGWFFKRNLFVLTGLVFCFLVAGCSTETHLQNQETIQEIETPNCTPGYEPCLPPASDYDCAGGTGNGPKFTSTVVVTGVDIYGLDRDGNGIGCES